MALISCPECGREVSDKAVTCPRCGYPITIPASQSMNLSDTPKPTNSTLPVNFSQDADLSSTKSTTEGAPKKKRVYWIIGAIFIVFAILCGVLVSTGFVQMNDNNLRSAKIIVDTVDKYLDGKTNAKTAWYIIKAEADNIDESDTHGFDFSLDALMIQTELSRMAFDGNGDLSKIKEYRNEIAGWAGMSKHR